MKLMAMNKLLLVGENGFLKLQYAMDMDVY